MRIALTDDEYFDQLATYEQSVFRLEQQPAYAVDFERDLFDKFVAGTPEPPTQEEFRAWYAKIRAETSAGITFERVRLFDDPPTDYQRWTRYMDRWNIEAGEVIDYLRRDHATRAGITEAFAGRDFWLLDDARLMLMSFDDEHRRSITELSTEENDVHRARSWRDLAIRTARKEGT